MPVLPSHSLTAQSLDAKFANKQRRYESRYSASYLHQSAPQPRLAAPPRAPNPTFETLRAAAARLNLPEEEGPHGPFAAATLPMQRRPARKARRAAVLALCALAAGGYYMSTVRAPGGGLASNGAILATLAQRLHDFTADQPLFHGVGEKIALLQAAWPKAEAFASSVRDEAADFLAMRPTSQSAQPVAELAAAAVPGRPAPDDMPNAAAPAASVATAQQLVDTLALVRQMGLLVHDVQGENDKLRTQVTGLTDVLQSKVTDLEQRLVATAHDTYGTRDEAARLRMQVATLADTLQASSKAFEQRLGLLARNPAASDPGKQQAEAPASPAPMPDGDGALALDAGASGSARAARDYRVQAASFGVAVLGDANPMPGQVRGYLVTVGDQVPGVGRVTSITPHGTSWVVQTDHGAIR